MASPLSSMVLLRRVGLLCGDGGGGKVFTNFLARETSVLRDWPSSTTV